MKKSALRFLIFTGLFKVIVCALFGSNIYVHTKMSWSEARKYCREQYTDLSSINSQEEYEELYTLEEDKSSSNAWIGLYKDTDDIWKWSGGRTSLFFNWSMQHNENEDNRCVAQNRKGWQGMDCETNRFRFYCFQSTLVLVKENKTWEEAMEQCRHQDSDLLSLQSESALAQTLQTIRKAQTDQVWIALRYLAGSWLWVDGGNMEYQAWSQGQGQQCPNSSHHCGALSLEGQHWSSRDCMDKFNFVCY